MCAPSSPVQVLGLWGTGMLQLLSIRLLYLLKSRSVRKREIKTESPRHVRARFLNFFGGYLFGCCFKSSGEKWTVLEYVFE